MTEKQFKRLAENFCNFAGKLIEYQRFYPSVNEYRKASGILHGIGEGCNVDNTIIANGGRLLAIHYSNVKMPFIR